MNTLFRKQYQSGGVYQTKGDPWEYKHDNGKWTTRKIGNKSWLKLPDKAVDVVTKRYLSDTTSKPNPIVQQPLYIAPMGNDIPQTYGTLLDPVTVMAPRAINTPVAPIIPAATDSYLSNPLYRQQRRAEIDLTGPVNLKPDINKLSNYNSSIDYKGELINFIRKSRKQLRSSYNNLSNMTSQDFDKFDRRTEDDVAYIKNLSNEQAFNALKATKYNENYPRSYSHGGKLYRGCTSCDKKKYQLAGGIRNIFGSIKDYFSPDPNYQAIPSDDVLPISSSDPQMKFAVPAGTVLTDEGDPNYIYPTTGVTLPEVVVTSERTPTGKVRQCDESGCAEYTIAQLERNEAPFSGRAFNPRPELSEHQPTVPMAVASAVSPFRERTGISGDAWNIYGNIIDYGGKNIYNRFPESAHHTNKSFKSDELQVGDVIGLWNRDLSPELEAEGLPRKYGVKNTHVGFVSHIEPDGSRLVEHNVYGNVYRHKISPTGELLNTNWEVATAARPSDYSPQRTSDIGKVPVNGVSQTDLSYEGDSPIAADLISSLVSEKYATMDKENISEDEFNMLARVLRGILHSESEDAENKRYKMKQQVPGRLLSGIRSAQEEAARIKPSINPTMSLGRIINRFLFPTHTTSVGPYQQKYYTKNSVDRFGSVDKLRKAVSEDPNAAHQVAFDKLLNNYKRIIKNKSAYDKKGIGIEEALIRSWRNPSFLKNKNIVKRIQQGRDFNVNKSRQAMAEVKVYR